MKHQTSDEILADVFDIEPITNQTQPSGQLIIKTEDEKETDLQYVRTNLYDLINKGSEAVSNALAIASESQHPRAFEVAGNLIKNVADLTDKLVTLQKARRDLNPEEASKNVTIEKAVFVGSTADLLKNVKKHDDSSENDFK